MKKTSTSICILILIVGAVQLLQACNGNRTNNLDSTDSTANFNKMNRKVDSAAVFEMFLKDNYHIKIAPTEPIAPEFANKFRQHFIDKFRSASQPNFDVWVDKSKIFSSIAEYNNADGYVISPICYTEPGTSAIEHQPYNQDDIGFMISLTKSDGHRGHVVMSGKLFDFNNPCPNYPNCK